MGKEKTSRQKEKGLRDLKKQGGNVKSYYRKNRSRLLSERNGERRTAQVYQISPKHDLDKLKYRKQLWELNNVMVDTSRYFEAIENDVNSYFAESTDKYVDLQMLSLHTVPYSHRLFPALFTLKIVVSDSFLIPRILDYHYRYYLKKSGEKENSKENRIKFLDFLEFDILQLLHVRTPFNYIEIGNYIVAWLREKRKKIQTKWPIINDGTEKKEKNVVNIENMVATKLHQKFMDLEDFLLRNGWLTKNETNDFIWDSSKKNLAIAICIMNEKKYFGRDIFDKKKDSSLRHDVKRFFETRYQTKLVQYLEPSRIKPLDLSSYYTTKPFNLI